MTKTLCALRPTIVLFALMMLAGCTQSQVEDSSTTSDDAHTYGAGAGLPAGRIEIGEKLAYAKSPVSAMSCVDCHGVDGNSPIDPSYPKLGGQHEDYLAHALHAYRNGDREHPLMALHAAPLTDQDIADLARYFGSRSTQLRDLQGIQ